MNNSQQFPKIPKMYQAQVDKRCSLQYVAELEDLDTWVQEWTDPKDDQQPYQLPESTLGQDSLTYRMKIKFSGRVFSNCGRDSIPRPVLGKNGIPCIPGSSVKGLFRRACNEEQKIWYCGNGDQPGKLRFHGAYPIGDWTGKKKVPVLQDGQRVSATRYCIVDLVHPQQERQVVTKDTSKETTTAIALISFYEPTFLFEFSSRSQINWQEVDTLLRQALRRGLGGKTSTGYGLSSEAALKPSYAQQQELSYQNAIHVRFKGSGVSSVLLNKEPEFRPNLFKATLRGHIMRLLAGCCGNENSVRSTVDDLFGSTNAPGTVQIFWESGRKPTYNTQGRNPTYSTQGTLHIQVSETDRYFVQQVLRFAYIMGGFGKAWRRVSHEKFYPTYSQNKFEIGCHWECLDSGWINISTTAQLKDFLLCCQCEIYQSSSKTIPLNQWREAWNPKCVAVYSSSEPVKQSKVVQLFHDEIFKTTPAIGGRNPHKEHPKKFNPPQNTSSVWHRMLPIGDNQYLEIVTVFHGDRAPWKREGTDQLKAFTDAVKANGLQRTWGTEPWL
ncbi:MAG: hypothetical protein KME42_25090 [Tildeniella nuda ZEHNDER 1965/U140]|jgi:CRISPR-associated protein Cmr6|nr:hypothetical protein [Tildeniella nuda ZEHNDER 1965/U140]